MHAALRKWVLVALSLFNLLANVALLNSSFSCPRGPMNQLGIDARGVVYVLKYVVGTSIRSIQLTESTFTVRRCLLMVALLSISGAKNLRLAFARLVGTSLSRFPGVRLYYFKVPET